MVVNGCYYEDKRVIPVKKIEEKINELEETINKINNKNEGFYVDESIYLDLQKTILEQLIKENCEDKDEL